MKLIERIGIILFTCVCGFLAQAVPAAGQTNPIASTTATDAARDGQHDFDFELGSWKIHLKRLQHPLTGSTTWVEFDGTSVTRKVWDGRSQLEEFETDSAAVGHIEGLTLRLYNPQSHQWSLYWANSKGGPISPPQIGEFKDGRGEFYAPDTLNGRAILVRFIWSNTNTDVPHFEQSFSDDGGKTWEVNWITDQQRVPAESVSAHPAASTVPSTTYTVPPETNTSTLRDGQHDFDFNIGTWKTQIKRLMHPITGSSSWVDMNGTVTIRKVWDGRAQIEEIEADGAAGHFEGLTLFLYDPQSHQWTQAFANSSDGVIDTPAIGEFKNGRGELFDQETYKGRAILVRAAWSDITPNAHRFEQSFSDDGGKTWEPNFVASLTRIEQ